MYSRETPRRTSDERRRLPAGGHGARIGGRPEQAAPKGLIGGGRPTGLRRSGKGKRRGLAASPRPWGRCSLPGFPLSR